MSSNIQQYRQEETIRRSFFKHRGNVNAIIEETGLDPGYIRKISSKIRKGFSHDINFETACFITDAILSGREQRLVILEDRLQEVLNKKETVSLCHGAPISEHPYEGATWYKCKMCQANCETMEVDKVEDNNVVKLIDRMRKEDELIGKFLEAMGIIANAENSSVALPNAKPVQSIPLSTPQQNYLPPADQNLVDKLSSLDETTIAQIRRIVEAEINEAIDGPKDS